MVRKKSKLDNLKPFQPKGEQSLSKKAVQVRINQEDYDKLYSLPPDIRLDYVRLWIKKGLQELEEKGELAS